MNALSIKTVALCGLLLFGTTLFSQSNSKVKDIGKKSLSGVTSINDLVDINRYIFVADYKLTLVKSSEESVHVRNHDFASFKENLSYITDLAQEGDLLYVEGIRCTFKDKCWWEAPLKMTLVN